MAAKDMTRVQYYRVADRANEDFLARCKRTSLEIQRDIGTDLSRAYNWLRSNRQPSGT